MTVLLGLAVFVIGMDTYIVAAVLPAIADDLNEPISSVGLIASSYALPVALLSPFFGPLSDRRGRRFALLVGLAIFTGAAAVCAVAPTLPVLLIARMINGIGSAILMPAAFAAAGDLEGLNARSRALAVLAATFPLSNLLGLPAGALATTVGGWRAPFVLIAILAVVAMVGVATSTRISRATTSQRSYAQTFARVLGDRQALAVMAVTLIWFTGGFGLFIYVGEFFHRQFGIPVEQAGLAYLVVGVVGIIAARSSGAVQERIGARRVLLIGLTVGGLAVFLVPLAPALPVALLLLAVWASGTWFGVPAMQTIVAGLSSTARGTMLAFNSSALNLGSVIGPIVSGRIIDDAGFAAAGLWSGFLFACALILAVQVLPHGERDVAAEPAPVEGV